MEANSEDATSNEAESARGRAAALGAGAVIAIAALVGLTEYQRTVWIRADAARSAGREISS